MLLVLQPFFFFFFLFNEFITMEICARVESRVLWRNCGFSFFFFFLNHVLDVSSREILEIGDAVS